jgi:hypothetical protein
LLKNDGEDYAEETGMWKDLLENMRVENLSGYFDINDPIKNSLFSDYGFGE